MLAMADKALRCPVGQWPAKQVEPRADQHVKAPSATTTRLEEREPSRGMVSSRRPWETREVKERDSVLRRHHFLLPLPLTTLELSHLWETMRKGEGREEAS